VPIIVEILSSKRLATAAGTDSAHESLACWYSFPNRQWHLADRGLDALAPDCRLIFLAQSR
jgi:hypothetical protein